MKNPINYWLALNHIYGLGSACILSYLKHFALQDLFCATAAQLREQGFTPAVIEQLTQINWQAVQQESERIQTDGQTVLTITDSRYPLLLREISSAPILLFVKGDITLLSQPQLAMVGSRNPSVSGAETATAFASRLVQAGLVITSGLALGIDAASHHGALAANGKTIAVLGAGLDRIYPARHRGLAQQILAQGGVLVSEFPPATAPKASHFPRRNRIISGLSTGCLVVEAALRSGSLITARYANEQGREVFAIPGSIHNPLARGCHALLKQGAKLVETANDVIEELAPLAQVSQSACPTNTRVASEQQQKLLQHIDFSPTTFDVIAQRSRMPSDQLAASLLDLEICHLIVQQQNGYSRLK